MGRSAGWPRTHLLHRCLAARLLSLLLHVGLPAVVWVAQLGRTLAHTWRAAVFVVDGFGRLKRAGLGTRLSLLLLEHLLLLLLLARVRLLLCVCLLLCLLHRRLAVQLLLLLPLALHLRALLLLCCLLLPHVVLDRLVSPVAVTTTLAILSARLLHQHRTLPHVPCSQNPPRQAVYLARGLHYRTLETGQGPGLRQP